MMKRSLKAMWLRSLMVAAAGLTLSAAVAPPADAGLQGKWRNTRNTVHLRLAPCGDAVCGTVIWANEEAQTHARRGSGKDILGVQLLSGLRQRPDGTWRGRVFVPAVNGRGSATVTQLSDKLVRVSGCMLAGVVCKTQHWHRVE